MFWLRPAERFLRMYSSPVNSTQTIGDKWIVTHSLTYTDSMARITVDQSEKLSAIIRPKSVRCTYSDRLIKRCLHSSHKLLIDWRLSSQVLSSYSKSSGSERRLIRRFIEVAEIQSYPTSSQWITPCCQPLLHTDPLNFSKHVFPEVSFISSRRTVSKSNILITPRRI